MKKFLAIFNEYHVDIFLLYIILTVFYYLNATTRVGFDVGFSLEFFCLANILMLIAVHAQSKYFDKKEDQINRQGIKVSTSPKLLYFSLILMVISLLLYFALPIRFLIFGLVFLFVGVLYSYPSKFRIKNILFLKNLVPAFIWFYSMHLVLFSYDTDINLLEMILEKYPVLLIFIAFEIMWDMPDLKGDKVSGVKTIPVVFGYSVAKLIVISLALLSFLTTDFLISKLITFIILVFTLFAKPSYSKHYYHNTVYLIFISILVLGILL